MASESKSLTHPPSEAIIERTRKELTNELFTAVLDGVIEQVGLTLAQQQELAEFTDPSKKMPEILVKRDDLVESIWRYEGEADLRRKVANAAEKEARMIEKVVEGVKSALKIQMGEMWMVKRIEGAIHRITLVSGSKMKVEIEDEKLIPTEYMKYTPSPDKEAIQAALAEGKEVPGCKLVPSGSYVKFS